MGREPVHVEHLAVGVLGGIQPDRLRSLLMTSDDDGLLARFMPIWPDPAPIRRPDSGHDDALLRSAMGRLLSLTMHKDEQGHERPWFVHLTDDTQERLLELRHRVRAWEGDVEGLLLSFMGKLPGLTVRLSLVLAFMDWASGEADEPHAVTAEQFGRAAHLAEAYLLPMARRAYAEAAAPKAERAARRLAALIREKRWEQFTSREVLRLEHAGIASAGELNPALTALDDAGLIRSVAQPAAPRGGRPWRSYLVNPTLHKVQP